MDVELLPQKTLQLSSLQEIVDNKSIAVVGNAESIFFHQFGNEIDNHAVVIRMNKGYIKNTKAQGCKTTIWAGSSPMSEKEIIDLFSPHIYMWMTPKLANMPQYSDEFLSKMFIHPKEIWDDLFSKLNNTRPTTGMMVINFLLNYTSPQSVSLYGFDFFKTKSFYERKIRHNTPHNFNSEEKLVYTMIEANKNLTIKGNQVGEQRSPGIFSRFLSIFK